MRFVTVILFILVAGLRGAQGQRVQLISDPERLSGIWEASDGSGGAVGLHLSLTTKVDGTPATLNGVPQHLDQFVVGVYQRSGSDMHMGDESNFVVPSNEVHWNGRSLRVKHLPRTSSDYEIEMDLTQTSDGQSWTGLFHRGSFSKHLSLNRPTLIATSQTPFAGTWSSRELGRNRSVHIGVVPDGTLVAWADSRQGLIHYANHITPPSQSFQYYGEMVQASREGNNAVSLVFNAFAGICCPATIILIPSKDGLNLVGNWQAGPNQVSRQSIWKRVTVGQSYATMN